MVMHPMKLPLQMGYTRLIEGCPCPMMPNDDEGDFLFHSSRLRTWGYMGLPPRSGKWRGSRPGSRPNRLDFLLSPVAKDGASWPEPEDIIS